MTRGLILLLALSGALQAETGRDAWLRYAEVNEGGRAPEFPLPPAIVALGRSPLILNARNEMMRAVKGMFERTLKIDEQPQADGAIVFGTVDALRAKYPQIGAPLKAEGFRVQRIEKDVVIAGADPSGVLYGTFALLRRLAQGAPVESPREEAPRYALRWVNHWDNLDGTIERGYGGRSIFWDKGTIRPDLTRVSEYARLLASVGINACSINNVNANIKAIDTAMLPELKRVAATMRPWGVHMALSLDFGSPKSLGGLDTFDPADPKVIAWWAAKVDEIYAAIPDLAGFVLKADSEGRVGPSAYNRTHGDAANVIARPTKKHGGILFYRGFVYDHHMDWRNLKNDRARAAYDNLHPLDGQFDDNVIVQIKHGPIDFQVREPVSPLFAGMDKTRKAIELQITQEYFGQGRHTVFLAPMWQAALDFVMTRNQRVTDLVDGLVGVSNVGLDDNWFGNQLSQANLYAFGRLAWNPGLPAGKIAAEWSQQTFSNRSENLRPIVKILTESWRNYENYSGNLGLQTLTEMTGTHYGPSVEASERNGWGQWHRSDANGAGMDRTVATGTGFIGQYPPEMARVYESLQDCPDDLLLFFHHVPYTHKLHSGETVIQHIYDAHYEGAAAAESNVEQWRSLRNGIDDQRYNEVLAQLEYQAGHAEEWRDSIVSWFFQTTGIPDAKGRAGHYPNRIEAEAMTLDGYVPKPAVPWETASGGTAVECPRDKCQASFSYDGPSRWSTIRVRYFDRIDGVSHFKVSLGEQVLDEWNADDHFPSRKLDGASSTRRMVGPILLRKGDRITIEGTPGGAERAPLDYVEVLPVRVRAGE